MAIITASMLKALSTEKKIQFEGLLPLIVKRLIVAGVDDLSSLRIPSGDDIWASGFDGIVTCSTGNAYVAAGTSVWEFGTSKDPLSKIESDYEKRTANSLGIDKSQTHYYLVTPKIWAYKKTKTEWESEHTDWKTVRVYDASILSDWINSEPTIVSWLLETLYGKYLDFSGIEQAWNLFSRKTNPALSHKMFLDDRETEIVSLVNSLQQPIIRVRSDSFVDSIGFVLCALGQRQELADKCIVVNDPAAFRTISDHVKNKIIILNFTSVGDIIPSGNSVIVCYNKEAISVRPDIQLQPYTKMHFINVFRDMGMNEGEAHEVYAFCHGNLRALIRRIPGIVNEHKPEWTKTGDINLLEPLVYLRTIDPNRDKEFVEKISNTSFERVEGLYKTLLQKEDTPIKRVENYFQIVNYEEAWDCLGCCVHDGSFDRFHSSVKWYLETLANEGQYSGKLGDAHWIQQRIHNLFLNYAYYSFYDNDSEKLSNAVSELLAFGLDNRISNLLLDNLSVLAEAVPLAVFNFVQDNLNTHLLSLFHSEDYKHEYTGVLSALDELTLHKSTAIPACKALFSLYQKDYEYKIANTPKESLLTALCFYNSEVALTVEQKRNLIAYFRQIDAPHACALACELIGKNSFWKSVRYGKRHNDAQNELTIREIIDASEYVTEIAFEYCNACGDVSVLQSLVRQYISVRPMLLEKLVRQYTGASFIGKDLLPVIFQLREQIISIQKNQSNNEQPYLPALRLWLDVIQTECSEEERNDWLFYKTYECPSETLLGFENDYHKKEEQKKVIRVEKLKEILSNRGITGIIRTTNRMENSSYWGAILSEVVTDVPDNELIAVLLSDNKHAIIGGWVDSTSLDNAHAIYSSIPYESRFKLLCIILRLDFWQLLKTEEEKKEFWKFKDMFSFDEAIYDQFLAYNPIGLLMFVHRKLNKEPLANIHQAITVLRSIANNENSYDDRIQNDEYHISEIVKIIDSLFYSDEWAGTTLQLYNAGMVREMPLSGKTFYFHNPHSFVDYISSAPSRYFSEQWRFSLPKNACDEYDRLVFFVETLIGAGYKGLAGNIIGKMPSGKDGIRLHENTRALLEHVDDSVFDRSVISGIINSGGFRTITDGTNQKSLASKYERDASEMELFYPHSANVLRELSHLYMSEGKQEHIYSEIYGY